MTGISGMAWFEPPDADPRTRRPVTVEQPPAYGTGLNLSPHVAGRALVMSSQADSPTSFSTGNFIMTNNTQLSLSSSTEAEFQMKIRVAGHFCFLGGLAIGAPNSNQLQFRKNGANGIENFALANSAWNETVQQDNVVVGDLVNLEFVSGTGAVSLAIARQVFSANGQTSSFYYGTPNQAPPAGTTTYHPPCGQFTLNSIESRAQIKVGVAGILQNLQCYITTNTTTANSTIKLRVNGSTVTQNITIGAGATGFFEDTVNTDHINVGDLVSFQITVGSGGNLGVYFIGETFTADGASQSVDIFGTTNLDNNNFTGNKFLCVAGNATAGNSTEAQVKGRTGYPATYSQLRLHVFANSRAGNTTVTFRINGANGNQTITIAGGATGDFIDNSHTDVVAATDDVDILINTASASAEFGVSTYGLTVADNGGGTACGATTTVPFLPPPEIHLVPWLGRTDPPALLNQSLLSTPSVGWFVVPWDRWPYLMPQPPQPPYALSPAAPPVPEIAWFQQPQDYLQVQRQAFQAALTPFQPPPTPPLPPRRVPLRKPNSGFVYP